MLEVKYAKLLRQVHETSTCHLLARARHPELSSDLVMAEKGYEVLVVGAELALRFGERERMPSLAWLLSQTWIAD